MVTIHTASSPSLSRCSLRLSLHRLSTAKAKNSLLRALLLTLRTTRHHVRIITILANNTYFHRMLICCPSAWAKSFARSERGCPIVAIESAWTLAVNSRGASVEFIRAIRSKNEISKTFDVSVSSGTAPSEACRFLDSDLALRLALLVRQSQHAALSDPLRPYLDALTRQVNSVKGLEFPHWTQTFMRQRNGKGSVYDGSNNRQRARQECDAGRLQHPTRMCWVFLTFDIAVNPSGRCRRQAQNGYGSVTCARNRP